MKSKRILLHICILVLAIISMGAGMYVAYHESRGYYEDYEYYYTYDYSKDVESVLYYGYVENTLRTKYGNADKVLIEDKERGNVTVGDIWEIFEDKYGYYYSSGAYTNYADWEEFEVSWEYSEQDAGTLYEIDYDLMKTYKKQWKKDKTNKNLKDEYTYYSKKCGLVNEYAELVEQLLWGMGENGEVINDIDINTLLDNAYPSINSGLVYYVEYKAGGNKQVISNVPSEMYFESENIVDLVKKEAGKSVQKELLYGNLELEALPLNAIDFLKKADKFYTAIDTNDTSAHYNNYIQRIEKQKAEEPTEQEIEAIKKKEIACVVIIVISLIIAFILYVILMIMAGHREKGDEPQIYKSDRIWLDLFVAIVVVIYSIVAWIVIDTYEYGYLRASAIMFVAIALPAIEAAIWVSESLMRRIKTKSLMQTTLMGKIWKCIVSIAKKIKKIVYKALENMNVTIKVLIVGGLFIIWEFINSFLSYGHGLSGVIIQVILATVIICAIVWYYFYEIKKIKEGAVKIAQGDIDYKIEEDMKFFSNKKLKESVNSIGDGLNDAVVDSLKNERMKTELIANVSHDLKTPLTSIINYVDLLKTEGLDSENAAKYLDVLDKKSQRLKNLTEDLVEVSKLNSGAVSLQLEKIDIVQLVKQSLGEYAEKFQERKLQVVKNIQQEPIYVMADGSKTWRLFENLYQNVYKYAMPGTRVYIDIKQEYGKVVVSVKNISEGPLNFSADELMERFVRGDVSRTTEGSGLGLSIARSIAERQKGSMNIVLDGDLFKVEIMINLINQ